MRISPTSQLTIGLLLMSFCGTNLSNDIGGSDLLSAFWLPGFAVGILLIVWSKLASMANKIETLESQLESLKT